MSCNQSTGQSDVLQRSHIFPWQFPWQKDRVGSLEMIVACRSGQLQDGHTSPGSTCSEGLGMTL